MNRKLPFIEHLLHARHVSKHFYKYCFISSLQQPNEGSTVITFILQIRRLRLMKVMVGGQDHRAVSGGAEIHPAFVLLGPVI